MNDELQELLTRADASAPPPVLDAHDLPNRIRHTARNQRRLAACGLAFVAPAIVSLVLVFSSANSSQTPIAANSPPAPAPTLINVELHERTALLLEASER